MRNTSAAYADKIHCSDVTVYTTPATVGSTPVPQFHTSSLIKVAHFGIDARQGYTLNLSRGQEAMYGNYSTLLFNDKKKRAIFSQVCTALSSQMPYKQIINYPANKVSPLSR